MRPELTQQDFIDCGWKDILANTKQENYYSMWRAFSDNASKAINAEQGKVLDLLSTLCSMKLSPENYQTPFQPAIVIEGRSSAIPEDFADDDIKFFVSIIDLVDNIWLKARIADFVWFMQKPKEVKYALLAIDNYYAIPLDIETWISGGQDCWKRAIYLSHRIKNAEYLDKIENSVLQALLNTSTEDGYLCFWLSNFLIENGLGKNQENVIAQQLESLGQKFEETKDTHRSKDYFNVAANWFKKNNDEPHSIAMIIKVAESWVKDALNHTSADNPSFIAAQHCYERAIQVYRSVPRKKRTPHIVDEKIKELTLLLQETGRKAIGEMGVISIPGINISQYTKFARDFVSGKSFIDALHSFVNLYQCEDVGELYKTAEERIKQFPLQALFQGNRFGKDGRVIAKYPASGFDPSSIQETTLIAEMIREYNLGINYVVQGLILPAYEAFLLEHQFRESDFIAIARQSPIVPIDRIIVFGKAIFAGFNRDFIVAIHLLVPQVENMIRLQLKIAGAKTTILDKDGIENETGLSTLMDLPEVELILDKTTAFEIKALFCDSFGPNLRNELAHGLLNDDEYYSVPVIYAWWFILKMVINVWWNATQKENTNNEEKSNSLHGESK